VSKIDRKIQEIAAMPGPLSDRKFQMLAKAIEEEEMHTNDKQGFPVEKMRVTEPNEEGGYTIYSEQGEEIARFKDAKTAAAHHALAIQDLDRLRKILTDHIPRMPPEDP
jgi:hypothetical protein